ncbi:MAG: response regulator [Alphaproteobacteria bacterium]|nr:response regulator [Alphaproteobacteria bacterium]
MDDSPLVLIADNNQVSREQMANTLLASGYRVIQAIDGGSALKVVKEHSVSVAIIDHFMDPHGGFDFARTLRNSGKKIPMILVTDEETSDLLMQITRHGISRYLKKPVDPKRLGEAVKRTLREAGPEEKKTAPSSPIVVSIMSRDHSYTPEELMDRALELGLRNAETRKGGPFGAVVADENGRILGEGASGMTSRCDPIAHAEVMAIRQATEALNQSHLETCSLFCSGQPTAIGQALIESVGLAQVYYALSHEDVAQIRPPKQVRPVPMKQLGHARALEILGAWSLLSKQVQD